MNHRPLSIIAVVALVALAGCSGLVPGGDSAGNGTTATQTTQSAATDTPTQTPTTTASGEATTTASMTAVPTATSTTTGMTQTATTRTTTGNGTQSGMFPPGYAASGITNPQRALERHRSVLSASDSYTLALTLNTTKRQFSLVRQVNSTNKRAYTTVNASRQGSSFGISIMTYQNGTTSYTKTTIPFSNQSRYNVTTQPFTAGAANKSTARTTVLGNVSYGDAERITRNGETLFRYKSTDLRNTSAFVPVTGTNATVKNFSATVLVTKEGVIRSVSYSITYTTASGERKTNSATVRLSRLGTTTVEEPAWLDEAKAQTGLSETKPPGTVGTNATTTSSG